MDPIANKFDGVLLLYNGYTDVVDLASNSSKRLSAVRRLLEESGYPNNRFVRPNTISRSIVELVHDSSYLDRLEELRGRSDKIYQGRQILPGSMDAIYRAAGAAVEAVTAMASGRADRVFGIVEPPGHHAERNRGMGFCAINNIAVAASYATKHLGFSKILIVDWDVHHGNGTQHAFENRNDVFCFDCHQADLFPKNGNTKPSDVDIGANCTVNVPLPKGMKNADYYAIFRDLLYPLADAYRPELVLVSAGFDCHRDDPLGNMALDESGFALLTSIVKEIADQYAKNRLLLMLEGGYSSNAVARSVLSCIQIMEGAVPPKLQEEPCRDVKQLINRAISRGGKTGGS